MAGRSALEHCPVAWRDGTSGDGGECALIALTGHATAVLFRPAPPAPIAPRPLLPALAFPTVPEGARPRLRRLLARKNGASLERSLIDLVTARGFAMHPADWMPSPRDDWAPDLYAPWLDWVRAESKAAPASDLTLENYDQWSWAERRVELAALRQRDPAAARAIIAAKAATEAAERRVKLIEILENNLSADDAEFLATLAKDRSERVQALASAYLARLGRHSDSDALAKELAEMLEVGKVGLVTRRTQLVIKPLKNATQNTRRRELFKLVSFSNLAQALGLSEQQLLESAPAGVEDGIAEFVQMIGATGSDEARRLLLDRMVHDTDFPFAHARWLGPRLTPTERRAVLSPVLVRDPNLFETTVVLMGSTLGEAPISALEKSPGYAALESSIASVLEADDKTRTTIEPMLESTLNRVALLADARAAAELISRVTSRGLSPADPRLELLHLNAALTQETKP
ncbi:DUF5691 domain-containing protein [Dongia deserti]|uniref:DUF5691 domain-containing protein n=1 Tax=Dongia deserti TaxID=2268030 RepID=UPI000E64AB87|nr:DUF5691 domain-containing protein [Dongia deserti]